MIKDQRLLRASPTRQTHDRRPLARAELKGMVLGQSLEKSHWYRPSGRSGPPTGGGDRHTPEHGGGAVSPRQGLRGHSPLLMACLLDCRSGCTIIWSAPPMPAIE